MTEDRYIELMNQEIDGENSPEESRALWEYLEGAPEAKRYYEELLRLGKAFEEIENVDPPRGMRNVILTAVAARGRPGGMESGSVSWFESLGALLSPRVACAFAAGLLLGLGLYAVLSNLAPPKAPGDRDALVGAMVDGVSGVTVEPLVMDLPGVSGTLLVRYSEDLILALLELSGKKEVRVVVECGAGTDTRFEGYRRLDGGDHSVRVAGERAELRHAGAHKYVISFRDPSRSHPAVHIQVFSAGELLLEEDVRAE